MSDAGIIVGWYGLAIVLIIFGPLLLGSKKRFYKSLNKPHITPALPTFIKFSVVFTLLAATSGWLFQLDTVGNDWTTALTLVAIYFGINFFFIPAFFYAHMFLLAFIIMLFASAVAIIACVYLFDEHTISGWLFLPTTIWSVFLCYCAIGITMNNREGAISLKEASVSVEKTQAYTLVHNFPHFDPRRDSR